MQKWKHQNKPIKKPKTYIIPEYFMGFTVQNTPGDNCLPTFYR